MTRSDAGQALAHRLYAAESAIDAALIHTARLAAYLPEARAEAYLSAVTGQKAFEDTAQSVVALSEARGHIVRTHGRLAALARSLGLEALAVGPVDKPEDEPPIGGGVTGTISSKTCVSRRPEAC
ncbi:hypothetical protein [Brevundimonas halotolerans]|uniref:Uncharacterized protein n=1 Tax=Brevundimonas halotolerans TaxID=69670 RepID=A0A7W9A5B1_9CAUL|nr:hypothetical protein [Brevundimonas halotolerans]MBB5661468.1 hypothetical protein [Brevundimonas halotolerans]